MEGYLDSFCLLIFFIFFGFKLNFIFCPCKNVVPGWSMFDNELVQSAEFTDNDRGCFAIGFGIRFCNIKGFCIFGFCYM